MRPSVPTILLLAALIAALAYQAGANRAAVPAAAPRPTVVGTIDLGRVLEQVTARAEWDATIRSLEEGLASALRSKQETLTAEQARILELPEGAEKNERREKLAFDLFETEAWIKWKRAEADRERSLMWRDLYRLTKEEAGRLAAAQGVDLLIVNDSVGEIRSIDEANVSAEAVVLQQITSRRVLYAARDIDLTDQLITRMNNAGAAAPRPAR
ncbi:MAG TPA: hypothetical protein PKC43_07675 [Phycisphaerales bacterium]|nr:hypothetical protein [Phycisphaerales bacterium]HMP37315.1 hypothetical protein [Phycisphaerales bacterium]